MLSDDTSVSAFPCVSLCNAAYGTGIEQARWSVQRGPGLSIKLPMVQVRSGVNLSSSLLSLYISLAFKQLWFFISLQHNDSPWRYSATKSLLPVLASTSFPRQKNIGVEQKLSLLKAVPCFHGNIYPDPCEITYWSPAASCPKFKTLWAQ